MGNDLWISLPSKDLASAQKFFSELGFEINERRSGTSMVSFFVGDKRTVVCLFPENVFQSFISNQVTDTESSNEFILSVGASSKTEVDEFAKRAVAAGGTLYASPTEKDGWMYGCGVADPDGHRWNMLYLDMTKMPR